eukprot:TRINITY_DN2271_c0_g1_i2.p1 TRINITY_DN2271_c0_g1~~TRINITY_DN2271_c0_g1_i2.p1  ORF type:complete len:395 (+),score=121.66 TRINITY_DN2271_c0_g1_i2:365-1549(+)
MVDSFKSNGFFILDMKDEEGAKIFEESYAEVKKFFEQDYKEKFKFAYPHDLAGYSNIEFENNDNKRIPENRDIFAIRPHLDEKLAWPSQELREKSMKCYSFLFEVTCRLLSSLAEGLEQTPSLFLDLVGQQSSQSYGNIKVGSREIELQTDPKLNKATNMCMFRYHDPINEMKEPQKCMIHQDRGLITLLPKASYPGLEVLHPHTRTFSPIESFTKPGQLIVFPGLSVEFMTQGYVPATMHRVVRSPDAIRFSMPFEVKPEEQKQLLVFSNGKGLEEYLEKGDLYKNPILPGNPPKHTARCDGCSLYIGGVRQKCSECMDYDLCDECFAKQDSIHPNHKFHTVEARNLLSKKPVEVLDFMRLAADMSRLNKTWKHQQQVKLSEQLEEKRKAEKK